MQDRGTGALDIFRKTIYCTSSTARRHARKAPQRTPRFLARSQSSDETLTRLDRPKGDPHGAEIGRARFLRCVCKDIAAPGNFELRESGGCNCIAQLCIQQSTGDSTGPEVDLAFRTLRDGALHENIRDL